MNFKSICKYVFKLGGGQSKTIVAEFFDRNRIME